MVKKQASSFLFDDTPPAPDLRGTKRGKARPPAKPKRAAKPPAPKPAKPDEPLTVEPKPRAPDDASVGTPFVRLLNRSSAVVPVPARSVISRIDNGYQFIHGEPAVPRSNGNASRPDNPGPYMPRAGLPPPKGPVAAAMTWLRAMQQDRAANIQNPLLDWAWLDTYLPQVIAAYGKMTSKA